MPFGMRRPDVVWDPGLFGRRTIGDWPAIQGRHDLRTASVPRPMWNSYRQLRGGAVTKILRRFILAIGFTVATRWIDGWPATGICARKTGAKIFPNLNHFFF